MMSTHYASLIGYLQICRSTFTLTVRYAKVLSLIQQ